MNPLSYANQTWPLARIVTAPAFGDGNWTVQPMWSKRRNGFGFELLSCSRVCLPAIGEAVFQYRYGFIDGMQVGIKTAAGVARRIAGSAWDPDQDAATAPDLSGYEVRIQLAPAVEQGVTPAWRTAWWGQVEYQEDGILPGAAYPAGVRTYRCVDGFARAKRWPLNRHSTYGNGTFFIDVEGHPGYNVGVDGRVIGNVDVTNLLGSGGAAIVNPALKELVAKGDTKYLLHTIQGATAASSATVQQSLEDAVRKTRGFGEPIFSFNGDTGLLGDSIAIPVRDGDTAWDLVARTCRRERGRGLVFVDWADDVAAPTDTLTVRLTVRPQTLDDIAYAAPGGGSSGTIVGAANTAAGRTATTVAVDVIGDHRLVADDTRLADKFLHVADAVETTSELIQLLVTLSYFDGTDFSLSKRWTDARATTFAGLTKDQRKDEAWEPMWQLHGLPVGWDGRAKDHNGGTAYYADFACDDDGSLITSSSTRAITSPILCRIMCDLPLMEGYDYSVNPPVRKIGSQVSVDETGQPARSSPFILIRTASNRYIKGEDVAGGKRSLSLKPRDRDVLIFNHEDIKNGTRVVGDTTTASLRSTYNLSALGVTVGLELPHRVRMKTVRTDPVTSQPLVTVKRLVTIRIPDLHVWLAHSGAIWDVDASVGSKAAGFGPQRTAGGGALSVPGKLRDDRDALARIHAMACAWYLDSRQTGKWTLRACGLLPSFETQGDAPGDPAETVTYPTIGYVVTDFKSSGQIYTFNTPITSISYDHQAGKTSWETDWQELDFQ